MLSHAKPAVRRAVSPPVPSRAVSRSLARYHVRHRAAVTAVADLHPRLADLAVSFPALLFALAVRRSAFDAAAVMRLVLEGTGLKEVSAAAGVPIWLRELPPEAFVCPLPKLPDGELFRRQIANHFPRSPKLVPLWLATVAETAAWGSEAMAVWIARELVRNPREVRALRCVYLWAWYSGQPHTQGHALVEKPWAPAGQFGAARQTALKWLDRVALHLELGSEPVEDMWLQPGEAGGYEFVPLCSAFEIEDEAQAMENCVVTYASSIADGYSRLWSMRREGRRIATLELAVQGEDWFPSIGDLKLANNERCSAEEWWAARRWLNAQHLHYVMPVNKRLDRARWLAFWKPYWLEKQRIPGWLPLSPSRKAFWDLMRTRAQTRQV